MSGGARIGLAALGLLLGVAPVLALREATLSTHEPVSPDSRTEVVLRARTHAAEHGQTVAEAVEAVLLLCRLEVASDLDGPIEQLGDAQFRAVLAPALDQTNRRQFRGCVEDWSVDSALLDVVSLESSS
jgi:hypothetical protein